MYPRDPWERLRRRGAVLTMMRFRSLAGLVALVTVFALVAVAAFLTGAALHVTAVAAERRCCFTNPQYSGACVVQPGEGESCASILQYLNNPRSQGKSYCGNTTIRGEWKQADCASKSGAQDSRP